MQDSSLSGVRRSRGREGVLGGRRNCKRLTYDGGRIVRASSKFKVTKFRGERQIISLPVFPSTYLDSSDG